MNIEIYYLRKQKTFYKNRKSKTTIFEIIENSKSVLQMRNARDNQNNNEKRLNRCYYAKITHCKLKN